MKIKNDTTHIVVPLKHSSINRLIFLSFLLWLFGSWVFSM